MITCYFLPHHRLKELFLIYFSYNSIVYCVLLCFWFKRGCGMSLTKISETSFNPSKVVLNNMAIWGVNNGIIGFFPSLLWPACVCDCKFVVKASNVWLYNPLISFRLSAFERIEVKLIRRHFLPRVDLLHLVSRT